MKKNKGFTLVEMIGVLIILIVVFMVMFPSLTKIIKETNEQIDNATIMVIEDATTDFLSEKNDIYPKNENYTYCINIEQLLDNGNLSDKEISSLTDTNKFVKTTFKNGKNVYSITDICTVSKPSVEFELIGDSNMSFEVGVGGQYVEPGATVKNKAGETVNYVITITNKDKVTVAYVDTTKIGIYTIKYSATIDGKNYAIERIVKVIDTTAPTITVNPTVETLQVTNTTYNVMSGITASDNSGVIPKISASSNLSLGQSGIYTITYTATDSSGNTASSNRTVKIADNELPTITFGTNGNSSYAKSRSTTVTASDDTGIDASSLKYLWSTSTTAPTESSFTTLFINGQTINTPSAVTGVYYLWIIEKDIYGNTAIRRTNGFSLDNTNPVITISGSSSVTIEAGSSYIDAGATATDNINGTLTSSIVVTSTVNTSVLGSYTVTYNVNDSSGNAATPVVRTVNVTDTTAPNVTFGTNGNSTYAKSRSTTVTVSDSYGVNTSSLKYLWNTSTTTPSEASFSTTFTNGQTISTPAGATGIYYLWIIGKDVSGNTVIKRSNNFNLDNTKPVITITGSSTVSVEGGSSYTDAGATATDNINGTITASIVVTSTVNTSILGTYTVTYNVSDSSGNSATPVVRTVNVVDSNTPIVTANLASYTVTIGTNSALPGTYFTINKNGLANIASTVCVDTSNGDAAVANLSTLTAGVHVIKCTATKTTGLSAYATTTIYINNYAVGQAITYAGINWHVFKINGLSATLLADSGTIATRMSFDTTYNASYPSCTYSPTGYCGNNVWSTSQIKAYLNGTWLSGTSLSTSNLIDDGNGYVRLITNSEYSTFKAAVGAQTWLYSSTISWWWTMTSSGTYKLYAITDAGVSNPLMEAFDKAYVRPVITIKQ